MSLIRPQGNKLIANYSAVIYPISNPEEIPGFVSDNGQTPFYLLFDGDNFYVSAEPFTSEDIEKRKTSIVY